MNNLTSEHCDIFFRSVVQKLVETDTCRRKGKRPGLLSSIYPGKGYYNEIINLIYPVENTNQRLGLHGHKDILEMGPYAQEK
jgi:hypothetical protein